MKSSLSYWTRQPSSPEIHKPKNADPLPKASKCGPDKQDTGNSDVEPPTSTSPPFSSSLSVPLAQLTVPGKACHLYHHRHSGRWQQPLFFQCIIDRPTSTAKASPQSTLAPAQANSELCLLRLMYLHLQPSTAFLKSYASVGRLSRPGTRGLQNNRTVIPFPGCSQARAWVRVNTPSAQLQLRTLPGRLEPTIFQAGKLATGHPGEHWALGGCGRPGLLFLDVISSNPVCQPPGLLSPPL